MTWRQAMARLDLLATLAVAALTLPMLGGCQPGEEAPGRDAGADGASFWTIVVLPDTQYYSAYYPDVYVEQTQWIVDHLQSNHIAFVLHEGDVVDDGTDLTQWSSAAAAMRLLDGVVPYELVPGNHDYASIDRNLDNMNRTFYAAVASQAEFRGSYQPNDLSNTWYEFSSPSGTWLVLGLEFGARDGVVAWANAILDAHPSNPAIIVTHGYLTCPGQRYDHTISPDAGTDPGGYQAYNPIFYNYAVDGGLNDAEMLWQKMIRSHPNVRFVFSGHAMCCTQGALVSNNDANLPVYQFVANYQTWGPEVGIWNPDRCNTGNEYFGDGYLRLIEFRPGRDEVRVRTYTPHKSGSLPTYLTDEDNDFVFPYP